MTVATITISDLEAALYFWEFGAWARTAWVDPVKTPGWVKQITRTQDREKDLRRYHGTIDDEYGRQLDAAISRLPEQQRDILVNIYVNLLSRRLAAKDLKISQLVLEKEQLVALSLIYGNFYQFDFSHL